MTDYAELTKRQQSLVDAIALNEIDSMELKNDEILDLASEKFKTDRYSDTTTVSQYRNRYSDIIDERVKVIPNTRSKTGNQVTVGNPMRSYTGPEEGIDMTTQHITERPVSDESEPLLLLAVDKDRLFQLLRSDDEELAKWAFEQLLNDE